MDEKEITDYLSQRMGYAHARQRMGIEDEANLKVFGSGFNFFHPENWYSAHAFLRYLLKLSGIYWYGRRNTLDIRVQDNNIPLVNLPADFAGFSILHLSDLHIDMDEEAAAALIECVRPLEYDICVITGDYRTRTYGPIENSMQGMCSLTKVLNKPVYAVLGNHDSIRMVPELEAMGIKMLLNESIELTGRDNSIYLAGIDDAHYYRVDNIEKSIQNIPPKSVSLLLSHTPEIYRQAAYAGFDVLFCGHTHGGQICLPGRTAIILDAKLPRYMGAGAWQYHNMQGYTSVGAGTSIVNVRLNCQPEVTLHHLSNI